MNNIEIFLALAPNTTLTNVSQGLLISNNFTSLIIDHKYKNIIKQLKLLNEDIISINALINIFLDNIEESASWYFYQSSLINLGLVNIFYFQTNVKLFAIEPKSSIYTFEKNEIDRIYEEFIFSKFAYLKSDYNRIELHSPLSSVKFVIYEVQILNLLYMMMKNCTYEEILKEFQSDILVNEVMKQLIRHNFIHEKNYDPYVYKFWEFEDLLFHTHSRIGFQNKIIGGTYNKKVPPLPAYKKFMDLVYISLPIVKSKQNNSNKNLANLLEKRGSKRDHNNTNPINIFQVSEFLCASAKISQVSNFRGYASTVRPYPSGGACYDLELYLVINQCNGLESGMYHYDACNHQLAKMHVNNQVLKQMLQAVVLTYNDPSLGMPQILIYITSRFGRISWKYSGIAYSLCLKHVGVLFQTMYLCATDQNLASCAIGAADAYSFAHSTGIDYFEEPLVGEFIIGSIKK